MQAQRVCGTEDDTLPMFPELPVVMAPGKGDESQGGELKPVTGVVEWFNPLVGHGEVLLADGTLAIIQLTSLARLFMHSLAKGAEVYGSLDETGIRPRVCRIRAIDWSKVAELKLSPVPKEEPVSNLHLGRVKWYDAKKGFGFIVPDGKPDGDVFVHHSILKKCGINADTFEGQRIKFEYAEGQKQGWAATSIQLV